MVNVSRKIETIDKFLESLIRKNNFSFTIPFHSCPDHNNHCKKHHSEIVISAYDKETKKFHLQYYGTHISEIVFEYDQPSEFVNKLIQKSLKSRSRLLRVRDLKKQIDPELTMPRKMKVNFRLSLLEYEGLTMKSKQNGMTLSNFSRSLVLNAIQ